MANSASFQITSDTAAETMAAAAQARHTPAAAPSVQTSRKVQVDTHGDGRQVTKDLSARSVETQRQVRPGNIIVGGVETSIEAARAAGLLPSGFDGPVGNKNANPAGNEQGEQQQPKGETPETTTGDATDLAAVVMDTLAGALGGDAVESGI